MEPQEKLTHIRQPQRPQPSIHAREFLILTQALSTICLYSTVDHSAGHLRYNELKEIICTEYRKKNDSRSRALAMPISFSAPLARSLSIFKTVKP